MRKYLAVLIIIVCTVLLQAHSIPFWLDQSNSNIGYLWSFTIEGAALWLWLNKKMMLATVASAIIILVPLMQLSSPLLKEIRLLNVNVEIKGLNSLSISQDKKLQDKYLSTSWAGTINKNTEHFRGVVADYKEFLISSSKLKGVYENIFIIFIQSVALIVILLTQIQALRMLAFRDYETIETSNFSNSEIVETPEIRAKNLLNNIHEYMRVKELTQLEFSNKLDISSSTISKLKNRVSGVGEPLSDRKLSDLERIFQDIKEKTSDKLEKEK